MKKNTKSPIKKEQTAKRIAKARRPVQREPKEVLAELVEKLRGKLEVKATTSASQPEAGPRGELSPNLDRLTVAAHYDFSQSSSEKREIKSLEDRGTSE